MPSAAENIELVKIRATYQVAIKTIENVSCIFVKFVGHKKQGFYFVPKAPKRGAGAAVVKVWPATLMPLFEK